MAVANPSVRAWLAKRGYRERGGGAWMDDSTFMGPTPYMALAKDLTVPDGAAPAGGAAAVAAGSAATGGSAATIVAEKASSVAKGGGVESMLANMNSHVAAAEVTHRLDHSCGATCLPATLTVFRARSVLSLLRPLESCFRRSPTLQDPHLPCPCLCESPQNH